MNLADISEFFSTPAWREPLCLWLALMPLLFTLSQRIKRTAASRFADAHLLPWLVSQQTLSFRQRLLSKNSAYILAWLFIAIALAGPRIPLTDISRDTPANIDIMLVVDLSRSMQVNDIQPNRLRRAQIEIEELLSRATGSRIGIIVFAARPHLLVPLTSDFSALRFYLRNLDSVMLPTQGSEPMAALDLASDELSHSTKPTAIVLLSDGDFSMRPASPTTFTTPGQTNHPVVYALGLGTEQGGAVPLENGQWLKHNGQAVISHLQPQTLRNITQRPTTDAGKQRNSNPPVNQHYSPATDDASDWQLLYNDGIAKLVAKAAAAKPERTRWKELYTWPLVCGLLLLWLSIMPYDIRKPLHHTARQTSRNNNQQFAISQPTAKAVRLALLAALLSIFPHSESFAANVVPLEQRLSVEASQAYRDYANGHFSAALQHYKRLTGFAARLGEGSSLYKLNNYSSAIPAFSRAVLAAATDTQRATALFNLGNSYFQTGNYAAAANTYQDALRYQPGNRKAKHNLDFSSELKRAVDQRIKNNARTSRAGAGPQLASPAESIATDQSGFLAIEENETREKKNLPLPALAELSNATIESLINKGLNHIQLAANDAALANQATPNFRQLAFITAQLLMNEVEDQQANLWKRLFEMEEGFPAPLSEPRQVPGVSPW